MDVIDQHVLALGLFLLFFVEVDTAHNKYLVPAEDANAHLGSVEQRLFDQIPNCVVLHVKGFNRGGHCLVLQVFNTTKNVDFRGKADTSWVKARLDQLWTDCPKAVVDREDKEVLGRSLLGQSIPSDASDSKQLLIVVVH